MALTQELDDACEEIGSKIILTSEILDDDSNQNISMSSIGKAFTSRQTVLRAGKPGKLFLKPNYTAFTKTNLGSIPSKVEKTLIKTEESIPITLTLNKQIQKINIPSDTEQKPLRNFSTSFSSKGYGVGFVSKVPRFDYRRKAVYPGPGDYSPEKNDSMENNINKSILGKSVFSLESNKSLQLLNTNKDKFFTSQEIISLLKKNYNARYNNNKLKENATEKKDDNIQKEENNKGNYYFESKVKKFTGGIFNVYNKNPGPGKYFIDTNFKIKNKDRKSPDFMEPLMKKEDPLKSFGIKDDNDRKIGFSFIASKKGGKVTNLWNGSPFLGYSYDFGKTLKNMKENKNIKNFKNKVINLPDIDMSNNLKHLGTIKKNYLINDYLNLNNNTKDNFINKYTRNFNTNINAKKDFGKFRKKDYFSLSAPRWDEGHFHDNESHFQIPGPAYYTPKEQLLKRSFNLNNKDFIYTNGVPFIEKKYSEC